MGVTSRAAAALGTGSDTMEEFDIEQAKKEMGDNNNN